jgi:hypothetical protein
MTLASQPLWLAILSLGLTGSIVGAAIAAVASALNDRSRRAFELRKWRAEFYLRPKLEALRNLHGAMVRSHYEINMRAKSRMPQNSQEYREQVERYEMDFFGALNVAEIYMDRDTSKALHAVLGSVRQMSTSIWLRLPEVFETHGKHQDVAVREPDWQLFSSFFDAAEAQLRSLLHPNKLLEAIEK